MRSFSKVMSLAIVLLMVITAGCSEVTGVTTPDAPSNQTGDISPEPEVPDIEQPEEDEQPSTSPSDEPREDDNSQQPDTDDEGEDSSPASDEQDSPGDEPTQPEDEPGEEPTQEPEEPAQQPEGEPEEEPEEEALSGTVKVHYIDVGQGDSILIQAPGKTVLIDGGPRSAGPTVVNYLLKQGVSTIDLVVSTHPHEDHIGGLINVLTSFTVGEVIDPAIAHTSKTFENYIDMVDAANIPFTEAQPGITRDLGGTAQLQVIGPKSSSSSDLNNSSVVVKLTFGDTSFLFAGDAEQEAEQQMLNSGYSLLSTVLKIGHHGSETSTSQAFLNKVKPTFAIISAGAGNSYEHPRQATLDKLKAANINTYRTDTHGNIIVKSDGYRVTVSTDKSPSSEEVFTGADASSGDEELGDDEEEPPADSGTEEGKFVGSTGSNKYHWPTCRYAEKILPENEIWFKDAQEALAAGYVPCGVCDPPTE